MKMIEKTFLYRLLCWSLSAHPAEAAPGTWHCQGEQGLLLGSTAGYFYRFTRKTHLEAGLGLRPKDWQRIKARKGWRKWRNYSTIATCTLQHTLLQNSRLALGLGYGPALGWKVVDLKAFAFADLRLLGPISVELKGGGKLCCWKSRRGQQRGMRPHIDVNLLIAF